ncbi:MAG: GAF domain-containing protein [Bacteroidota bacterium]
MNKLPIPANEPARLKAVKALNLIDSENEQAFDIIAELASIVCETPISLLTFIDEHRQWFKAKQGVGAGMNENSRDQSFCQYAIMDTSILEVEDATLDTRFSDLGVVKSDEFHVRFYAGIPLIDPEGLALGTLCVIDTKSRQLTEPQKRALTLLSQQAAMLLKLKI